MSICIESPRSSFINSQYESLTPPPTPGSKQAYYQVALRDEVQVPTFFPITHLMNWSNEDFESPRSSFNNSQYESLTPPPTPGRKRACYQVALQDEVQVPMFFPMTRFMSWSNEDYSNSEDTCQLRPESFARVANEPPSSFALKPKRQVGTHLDTNDPTVHSIRKDGILNNFSFRKCEYSYATTNKTTRNLARLAQLMPPPPFLDPPADAIIRDVARKVPSVSTQDVDSKNKK